MPEEKPIKTIATNRRAGHDYTIIDTYEAGIELKGSEVKSIRAAKVSFKDSFAIVHDGEVILLNLHIAPYDKASAYGHDPERKRRLLLHRSQIRRLKQALEQQGLTLVPLSIYFRGPYAKVELGLARGKRKHDKREAIAKRDAQLAMRRAMRGKR